MDAARIPKIISVDDHVVEPAHVWDAGCRPSSATAGPRVERRGVASIDSAGAAVYKEVFDDDVPAQGRHLGLRGPRLHAQAAWWPPSATRATR